MTIYTLLMYPTGVKTEKLYVMLQSGCPDCLVVKLVNYADILMLFSKENNVIKSDNVIM